MYVYQIIHDEDCESPRENSNLGVMYCWHRRMKLGDIQPKETPHDAMLGLIHDDDPQNYWDTLLPRLERYNEYDKFESEKREEIIEKEFERRYISLAIYIYEHSGITMRYSNSQAWNTDGFICVAKSKIRKEYGWKLITYARIERIESYLRNEVDEYARYLEGDCWGFNIFHPTAEQMEEHEWEDGQEVDEVVDMEGIEEGESVGGFIGRGWCVQSVGEFA